jgi:uncharacterized damage-inducible protein DinB
MNEVQRIAAELSRGYDGEPWHGPSVTQILEGISADEAAARPLAGANSIWEIALHMTAWIEEIRVRLAGKEPSKPVGGEWPPMSGSGEVGWEAAKESMGKAIEGIGLALSSTPEARLWETVGKPARDLAAGTGTTYYVLLHGLVQHNVYHSAQIATLKRVLRAK